jgi:hypothetical protein
MKNTLELAKNMDFIYILGSVEQAFMQPLLVSKIVEEKQSTQELQEYAKHLAAFMARVWRLTFLAVDREVAINKVQNPIAKHFLRALFTSFDHLPRIAVEA